MEKCTGRHGEWLFLCALFCCLLNCNKNPVNPQSGESLAGLRVLFQQYGGPANGQFGFSVAAAKDMKWDSIPFLIVGAPNANDSAGSASVYMLAKYIVRIDTTNGSPDTTFGNKLSLLYQRSGAAGGDQFGFSVAAAGYIDGDTTTDFIVGAPQSLSVSSSGQAFAYSGATGTLLYQQVGAAAGDQFGRSVAVAGDVNGDGKADFIIGAPGGNAAFVYSGATGTLLYQKAGDLPGSQFGYAVAGTGDLNSDGRSDFIVGAPYRQKGSAFVYSGGDGSLLYQLSGGLPDSGFGFSVAGTGDVSGDGSPDFVVGAPFSSSTGLTEAGSVYIYSGSTGTLHYSKNGTAAKDRLGWSVAGAGDFNDDSKADVIVGAPSDTAGGAAFVYSGATGKLLSWAFGAKKYRLGYSVADAGDIYRDATADVIVGVPFVVRFVENSSDSTKVDTLFDAGSVYVFSGL